MSLVSEIFSWWGGSTWGTRWTVWRQGRKVGTDEFGNVYWEQRTGSQPLGRPRRWVIYSRLSEPSQVPSGWHGWLHHTTDAAPVDDRYQARPWQRQHVMNGTGSSLAYRPKGSLLATGTRPRATGDYKAWRPE